MVKERIVITDDSVETIEKGDRVVDVYPGAEPDEGPHIVVDREVPDRPAHKPGTAGVATVENNYGVAIPDQAGVWVSRGEGPQFVLFAAKAGRRAMYPASMVSDFQPDASMAEVFESLTKKLHDATSEASRLRRRYNLAEHALGDLVTDLHCLQVDMGATSAMRTSAGATMSRWLRRQFDMEEEK
jgi:hypothetical protein